MSYGWLDRNMKWIFTLPAALFVLLVVAFPIAYTVRISFYEWSMSAVAAPKWVGLENYTVLLADPRFWGSILRTLYHSVPSIIIETVLGVAIAVLFSRSFIGSKWVKSFLMLPMVATPVAIGLVWLLIYEPSIGLANQMLRGLGLKTYSWLGSVDEVIPSLIIIDVWQWTPMIALLVMAGITTLPTEPYESADVDGATSFQKFFHITLPLLRPTILIAVILRTVDLLKTFDTIYSTTQGGPNFASETLNIMVYTQAFQYLKLGSASALLMLFFLIIMFFVLILVMVRKRMEAMQ
ncbi:carbohydrate ABC transporter permease [Paenibacillus radicis (ex Xue et al. 2023)]|uniref:Sugar ABC transporter permease n=1 Tax=Paenibacillus radicis (ex Xue et al. 2023) TaxID=2972489 RepID=A0ABT1YR06_9BACL|nr:sugar ABC transporter permease [Paenibacillus radicis (ex Xue et al. 2023)]MCR8635620.1 sugar ABC transporter permease [Paenibacillus radicis (ex Xue et al. 2023)]